MLKKNARTKAKPSATVDANAAGRARAAAELGVSPFSLAVWEAAGCPCGEYLDVTPTARTIDEVGAFMGVSGRTISTWKAKGMPGGENGEPYSLPAVLQWRRDQPEPELWHATGSKELKTRDATGDLARAILRLVRHRLQKGSAAVVKDFFAVVFTSMPEGAAQVVEFGLKCALQKHLLDSLCLTDEQIETTVKECWHYV